MSRATEVGFKLWVVAPILAADHSRWDYLKAMLFCVMPDFIVHGLWKIFGDFRFECKHVKKGAPAIETRVQVMRNGKLLCRVIIRHCRDCYRIAP